MAGKWCNGSKLKPLAFLNVFTECLDQSHKFPAFRGLSITWKLYRYEELDMSQKKVDYYKEQKVNRKANMKKEKLIFRLEVCAIVVVFAALAGWFGFSVYNSAKETAAANADPVTTGIYIQAMQDYFDDLDADVNGEGEEQQETGTEEEIISEEENGESGETEEAGDDGEKEAESDSAKD